MRSVACMHNARQSPPPPRHPTQFCRRYRTQDNKNVGKQSGKIWAVLPRTQPTSSCGDVAAQIVLWSSTSRAHTFKRHSAQHTNRRTSCVNESADTVRDRCGCTLLHDSSFCCLTVLLSSQIHSSLGQKLLTEWTAGSSADYVRQFGCSAKIKLCKTVGLCLCPLNSQTKLQESACTHLHAPTNRPTIIPDPAGAG
jgi:hypothetical protein